MTDQNKKIVQRIILGAVVSKDGKILILQRHKDEDVYPGMWELPSGKREFLESSEKSLTREVREEAGLDIRIIMPFSVFDYQIEKPDEIRDSTQINFLVTPIGDTNVSLSSEHQSFTWIAPEEIDEYNLTDATKKVIQEASAIMAKIK